MTINTTRNRQPSAVAPLRLSVRLCEVYDTCSMHCNMYYTYGVGKVTVTPCLWTSRRSYTRTYNYSLNGMPVYVC